MEPLILISINATDISMPIVLHWNYDTGYGSLITPHLQQ